MWSVNHTLFVEKRYSHSSQYWQKGQPRFGRKETPLNEKKKKKTCNTPLASAHIQTLTDPACHVCQETLAAFKAQKVWLGPTWTQRADSPLTPTCSAGLKTVVIDLFVLCVSQMWLYVHDKLFWACWRDSQFSSLHCSGKRSTIKNTHKPSTWQS